jgi:hypothetical protein
MVRFERALVLAAAGTASPGGYPCPRGRQARLALAENVA